MKLIVNQLLQFVRLYTFRHWMLLLFFCGISVYVNYGLGLQTYISTLSGLPEFFAYMALYAVHALFAYGLYSAGSRKTDFWVKPGFWVLLLLGFAIFAARAVLWQHALLIEAFSPEGSIRINRFAFGDVFRFLYLFVPVTLVWFFADRHQMPLYGFSMKQHQQGVYWILLAGMVPLIAGASMLSDFLDYYPRFRKLSVLDAPPLKIWIYECFYGMDFVSIELFFRGFMVIAFIRYVGIHAVLPMAAFYLSIHYGKPMGEAISSFFGGTILGVIAFHSRSIYGGIMVHMGIAWLMELGAYIGNLIRGHW